MEKTQVTKQNTSFKLPEVFVVGSGRSGTTLLASMLNTSDQLYIPYESDFVARAYPYLWKKSAFSRDDYTLITKIFKITAKQSGWGMSEQYLLTFLEKTSPQSFSEVNAAICMAFHAQEGTEGLKWGIKAPVLIASLDRILNVCPKSKITHVVRDGRDVYLSYRKVHESSEIKFGPKGIVENALYWVDGLRRIGEFKEERDDVDIFELRYEDLLNEPDIQLQKLCDFLSIAYKPEMHEKFNQNQRNKKVAPDQFQQSIHKKLHGGLDSSNAGKYLLLMSKRELLLFELITAPYLIKYGYLLQYPFLGSFIFAPVRALLYFLARTLNDWRYSQRDRKMYRMASESM